MISKEKMILFVLAGVNFTHIMDFMIMMPLGPQLMDLFKITPAQFSLAVSSYSFTAGISGFASAFFVDKFDRKRVLLWAYLGFLVGTLACAFAPNYELLVAARILAGLFGGMIGAQVLSIVGDLVPYERRASAMGIIMTAFSLASVLGVPAGLWLANHFSWHVPFLFICAVGIVVAGFIFMLFPPITGHLVAERPVGNPFKILTDIAKNRHQMTALAFSATLMMGHFLIIPLISPSLVSNAGFRQDDLFLIYLVGGLLTIFTAPFVGKLADKRGKLPIYRAFALFSLIPIWLITNLTVMPLWVILGIAGLFFIATTARMIPMQAMVSNVVSPEQRGGFMSINSSIQQISSGIAANIGGFMVIKTADGHLENYDWVGYLSILLIFSTVFLANRLEK
jgi:MFS transporter, DHA1 family, inner membrane transport protein